MATPDPDLPRNIGAPATRALTAAGYTKLSQLVGVPADELAKLHGVGPKALRLLQEALQAQGKSLG
jgi:DNA polymerase/3'-5' exonuclease PolX